MEDGVPLNEVPYAAENIVVPPGGESHLTHIDQQLVDPCSVKPPAAEPPAAPPAAEPPAAEPPATGAKAAVQEAAAGEEADASSAGAQKAASDPLVKAQDMQRRLAATREETIDLTRDHASTPLANRPPPTPLEEMKRNQSNFLIQWHLIPRGDGECSWKTTPGHTPSPTKAAMSVTSSLTLIHLTLNTTCTRSHLAFLSTPPPSRVPQGGAVYRFYSSARPRA